MLSLVCDKEILNGDLSENGINKNPTNIYHLFRNTDNVIFWNSLPKNIKRSINFINKFIPNKSNRRTAECAGIYLYNFLIDTFKIPTLYLGTTPPQGTMSCGSGGVVGSQCTCVGGWDWLVNIEFFKYIIISEIKSFCSLVYCISCVNYFTNIIINLELSVY